MAPLNAVSASNRNSSPAPRKGSAVPQGRKENYAVGNAAAAGKEKASDDAKAAQATAGGRTSQMIAKLSNAMAGLVARWRLLAFLAVSVAASTIVYRVGVIETKTAVLEAATHGVDFVKGHALTLTERAPELKDAILESAMSLKYELFEQLGLDVLPTNCLVFTSLAAVGVVAVFFFVCKFIAKRVKSKKEKSA